MAENPKDFFWFVVFDHDMDCGVPFSYYTRKSLGKSKCLDAPFTETFRKEKFKFGSIPEEYVSLFAKIEKGRRQANLKY